MSRWDYEDRTPLAKIRSNTGLNLEKAAVAIGISSKSLARYEHGIHDIPMRIAEKLAMLYRVPFDIIRQAVNDTPLRDK